MHVPQTIMIALMAANLGIATVKHGEPEDSHYNVFITLASIVFNSMLLWWGGFWG